MAPDETIEMHERLARIEAVLEAIKDKIEDQKECDEKIQEKIDEILHNDKEKIEKIYKNSTEIAEVKTTIKNVKAAMVVFVVPIAVSLFKSFI